MVSSSTAVYVELGRHDRSPEVGFCVQSSSFLRPLNKMKEARNVETSDTGMLWMKLATTKLVPP